MGTKTIGSPRLLVRAATLGVAFACVVHGVYLVLAAPVITDDLRVGFALFSVLAAWGWIFAALMILFGLALARILPLGRTLDARALSHRSVSYRRAAAYQGAILAIAWATHPLATRVAERLLPRILNTRTYFEDAVALVLCFATATAVVYAWHHRVRVHARRISRNSIPFPVWLLGCTVVVARIISQTSLAVVFVGRELPLELATLFALAICGADLALALSASLRNRLFQVLSLGMLSLPAVGLFLIASDVTVRTSVLRDFTSGRVLLHSLRAIFDADGDGYAAVLGGGDCDDLDATVNPGALEIPGNQIDDNCIGGDAAPTIDSAAAAAADQRTFGAGTKGGVEVGDGDNDSVGGSADPAPAPAPDPDPGVGAGRSLVLIIIDSLRADAMTAVASFGADAIPAERLASFASRGTRFSRAYAPAPFTGHSILSFTTGRLPVDFGHPAAVYYPEPSIQEILRAHGYRTEAIYQLATINPYMFRGFDAVDDRLAERNIDFRGVTSKETTDSAIEHVSALMRGPAPFFLLIHYFDPHGEYMPRPDTPFVGDTSEARYWQEVRATDVEVGRLLDALDESSFFKRGGVVALTGDHGELLGDRDRVGHGFWVDEPVLRVPLVLSGGPFSAPAVVIDEPVSLIDLYPTFLTLALGRTASVATDGTSLLTRLHEARSNAEDRSPPNVPADASAHRSGETLFAQNMYEGAYEWIALDARFKLIEDLRFGGEELFDLDNDPLERKNVRDAYPEVRDRLYRDFVATLDRTTTTEIAERKAEAAKAHPLPIRLKRYAWRKLRRYECQFLGEQASCRQLADDIEKYGPE